jgi:hypothetical protein
MEHRYSDDIPAGWSLPILQAIHTLSAGVKAFFLILMYTIIETSTSRLGLVELPIWLPVQD